MIDINYYRQYESKAKDNLPSWIISKKYNLDIFEQEGFPVRINNIQQTRQLMDTMQENRFSYFMEEIGGFSEKDLNLFIDVCIKTLKFQNSYFPVHKPFIPFDTLMNTFVLFKKIDQLNPKAKKILEIGPGSASLSFFLNNFSKLKEYTYTEACESFYLLQNNINHFLFQGDFKQEVIEKSDKDHYENKNNSIYLQGGLEQRFHVKFNTKNTLNVISYPWWKLGKLNSNKSKYDIITSNANLLEFSEGALNDYLSIMFNKLKTQGMVYSRCLGWAKLRDPAYLFRKLKEHKFNILLYVRKDTEYECKKTKRKVSRYFHLDNMILIKEGHSLYDSCNSLKKFPWHKLSNVPEIDGVFFSCDDNKNRIYTKEEITKKVIEKLNSSS